MIPTILIQNSPLRFILLKTTLDIDTSFNQTFYSRDSTIHSDMTLR